MNLTGNHLSGASSFWKGRPCLVTGVAGFGGGHLACRLADAGAVVWAVDRRPAAGSYVAVSGYLDRINWMQGDLCELASLGRLLDEAGIEDIFHLAAQPLVPLSHSDPKGTLRDNVNATHAVLEAMRRSRDCRRLVYASSGAIYGTITSPEPLAEAADPGPVENVYAASKRAAESVVRAFAKDFGIRVIMCRFMNTYGPGDRHDSRLIPGAIRRLLNGEPYDFGTRDDGSTALDFLHIDDMTRAYLRAGERLDTLAGHEFNFGSGAPVPIREMAGRISVAFDGRVREPVFRGPRLERPLCKSLDIRKAGRLLGWRPEVSLEQGLRTTADWYRGRPEFLEACQDARLRASIRARSRA